MGFYRVPFFNSSDNERETLLKIVIKILVVTAAVLYTHQAYLITFKWKELQSRKSEILFFLNRKKLK